MMDFETAAKAQLPPHMQEGIINYIKFGHPTGDFLQAVIKDRFVEAFGRADDINLIYMRAWADYMYNYCPMPARGSDGAYKAWVAKGGLEGLEKQAAEEEKHATSE
jgi:hypothetical protein